MVHIFREVAVVTMPHRSLSSLVVTSVALVTGCASSEPAPARAPTAVQGDAIERFVEAEAAGRATTTLSAQRGEVVRIAPAPERPAIVGASRQKIDLSVSRADVAEVLHLLADAARLNIVVAEGVRGEVTMRLSRVDPLVAMTAVAEANQIELSQRGNVIVARRR